LRAHTKKGQVAENLNSIWASYD